MSEAKMGVAGNSGESGKMKGDTADPAILQDVDAWWKVYKKLSDEEQVTFVKEAIEGKAPLTLWEDEDGPFELLNETFCYLASDKRVEEGIAFLQELKAKKPDVYKRDAPYYDRNLIYCYALLDDQKKVHWVVTDMMGCDFEKYIDICFEVLDILRLYGCAEEVKQLALAAYAALKNSRGIIPQAKTELRELALFSIFRQHLLSNKSAAEAIKDLKSSGFDPSERAIRDSLRIFGGKPIRWSRESFLRSNRRLRYNMFLLGAEFVHWAYTNHSIELVTSDLFQWQIRGYLAEEKGEFVLTFSKETLDRYLASHFNLFSFQRTRGMAFLPALTCFSTFLYEKSLITAEELEEVGAIIDEFKEPLRKICVKEGWKYKFILRWKLSGEPLFTEDYLRSEPASSAVKPRTFGRKVGRNEPCPCGSGKKYKKCCGRVA